jgi:hypothetical protein
LSYNHKNCTAERAAKLSYHDKPLLLHARVQVRIRADPGFTKWDVEVAAPATFSRSSKLAPLFGIIFRRSSCQHPLLAGALGAPGLDHSPRTGFASWH